MIANINAITLPVIRLREHIAALSEADLAALAAVLDATLHAVGNRRVVLALTRREGRHDAR